MEELPLTIANVLAQCAVNGFYAGVIGNLVASGIQWAALKGHDGLRDILLKGTGSALKNHDLVRALVRSQLEAATQMIDITLLEDYGSEATAGKNWVTHLAYGFPGKALRDGSNRQIKWLWQIRTTLQRQLKELDKLSASALDSNLIVAVNNAQAIAGPDISADPDESYAEWSNAAATAMCAVLAELGGGLEIPEKLRERILRGEWTDLFRLAFREELKEDPDAETAYFINVNNSLTEYARLHARELGDVNTAFKKGYERHNEKLAGIRDLLFSVRSAVKSLETASNAERTTIGRALENQRLAWRTLMDEQQEHWNRAHAAHAAILKSQSKNTKIASLDEQCGATVIWEIIQLIPPALEQFHPGATIQGEVRSSTIENLRALLAEWQEFLLTDYQTGPEPESRIYHLEFSEFLRTEALRKPIDFVRITGRAFFQWQHAKRKRTSE